MNCPKRTHLFIGATLATFLLLTGCSPDDNDETAVTKEIIRPVKLLTIEQSNAINIRRFPAELKASEKADLAFRVGGQLMELNIVAGQHVKKGDLLAALDPTDFELKVELEKANQYLAQTQFKRIQTILKQGATTQSEYDSAKANLDQVNNALQTAKNQLKYTKLYAPFDGVIASVSTENFQYVSATQTLIHIQDINNLSVEFQIPDDLVVSIKSAQTGYMPKIVVDVAPNEELYGAYKKHKTTPDQSTMAYDVTLNLIRNGDRKNTLLPGMAANVDIDLGKLLGEKQHFVVPVEAVIRHEDINTGEANSAVWVFNKETNKVESRKVELGTLQGNLIEIKSGLNIGDQVVAAGANNLNNTMQVRPWTRERGL
ncbi:efflux RND transporter periplasmic adaptor subunit [Marinomonas transparens]|uniref:Efflux RND transporter periplasmic adaptor subunit n=1 Tax=Marinomonas transparens TaxID=2795388 RepID=A0A934JXX6_9GAMM|nr:efflux RND transporter periplasmic adaptor subunit [Marinomonas transparens]MBJ7538977.1 efflux RND transporter periplasmic adaptor subunit [Marinomonas transparens]